MSRDDKSVRIKSELNEEPLAVISRIPRPIANLPKTRRFEKPLKAKSVQTSDNVRHSQVVVEVSAQPTQKPPVCKHEVVDLTVTKLSDESGNNVDAHDFGDPQLCAEYAQDIYRYLRRLEKSPCLLIRKNYLENQVAEMPRYRKILVDWIVGVSTHFHLLQETLFLSVDLLDRYLQCCIVTKQQLQLVGTACLYVASKYEEIYPPFLNDFVYMTDHTYTKEQLLEMEKMLLVKLDYQLGKPLSIHFLRRYSKLGDADTREHNLAKYILECSLHVSTNSCIPPSMKAAAALHLSRTILQTSEETWPSILTQHSQYTPNTLLPIMGVLRASLQAIHFHKGSHIKYTRTKYQKEKFLHVSRLQVLNQLKQS